MRPNTTTRRVRTLEAEVSALYQLLSQAGRDLDATAGALGVVVADLGRLGQTPPQILHDLRVVAAETRAAATRLQNTTNACATTTWEVPAA